MLWWKLTKKLGVHKGQAPGPACDLNVKIKLHSFLQDNQYLLYILYKGTFHWRLSSVLGYAMELKCLKH